MFIVTGSRLVSLAVLLIALSACVSAQMINMTDAGLGGNNIISGMVLNPNGQRAEGHLSVRLRTESRGDRVAVTDDVGNFGFRGLVNGDYTLVIEKEKEYEPYFQNVNIFQMRGAPPQNVYVNIRLKYKKGIEAKPGVVNSELAGVPESAQALYKKAAELRNSGDHTGAIEQLKLAIADYPKFTLAYNDLGTEYMKLNDLARADDAFKTALNIDKTSFAPLFNHGLVLFNIKRYPQAEEVFRDVIKAKEGSAAGHFFLGQSLAYQAKWDEAEKELSTGITLGGEAMAASMKDGHRLLGLIHGMKGDKKRQIAEWEIYLKLAPDAADAEQIKQAIAKLRGN